MEGVGGGGGIGGGVAEEGWREWQGGKRVEDGQSRGKGWWMRGRGDNRGRSEE